MYILYWLAIFDSKPDIELIKQDQIWFRFAFPSESCWMIPNTVDPLS